MLKTISSTEGTLIFFKDVGHLVLIGVLEIANDLEWGAPYFSQPKPKTN